MSTKNPLVWIVMGSISDAEKMKVVEEVLNWLGVPNEVNALSAHRTPDTVVQLAKSARARGIKVIIAAAGGAAHLPGVIAAHTSLPVIGVPISGLEGLGGLDALLSIAQMPPGVPVATMAINGAKNAAVFAVRILAVCPEHADILERLIEYQQGVAYGVLGVNQQLHELGIVGYIAAHPPKA
ncbi:MAG: 5-(carboxyamino)imidazole ribonucleotide mutase [bacterium]|nr:5-(carboxyamino)imidazole ribonucleotide mutase [bacterium]